MSDSRRQVHEVAGRHMYSEDSLHPDHIVCDLVGLSAKGIVGQCSVESHKKHQKPETQALSSHRT